MHNVHSTVIAILLFVPSTLAQDIKVYFNETGDTVMYYKHDFNKDTKIWRSDFVVYSNSSDVTEIHREFLENTDEPSHKKRFDEVQTKYHVMNLGNGEKIDDVSSISTSYKIVRQKKVGVPEGLFSREYFADCSIMHNGEELMKERSTFYSWGKEDKKEDLTSEQMFGFELWKHPKKDLHFGIFSLKKENLVLTYNRLSYIEQGVVKREAFIF